MAQRLPGDEGCHLSGNWVLTPLLTFRKRPSPIIPRHLLFFLLSRVSMSAFPLSAFPQVEGKELVPGAKEQNNKYLYFPLLLTWSISICHGFLSHLLNYLSVLVSSFFFFYPFPVSSLFQPHPAYLSLYSTMNIAIQYLYSVVCQVMHRTRVKYLVCAAIHN